MATLLRRSRRKAKPPTLLKPEDYRRKKKKKVRNLAEELPEKEKESEVVDLTESEFSSKRMRVPEDQELVELNGKEQVSSEDE